MTESSNCGAGKCRYFLKKAMAVLTVFCAVGGVIYVMGFGKQIHEAVNKFIRPDQEDKLARRRYERKISSHVLSTLSYSRYILNFAFNRFN